ncbi:hypothetical protein [Cupriavidus oxalaticus]|uniref:hypothetical protein n=1 Tax=Cupriavidus oxalaticus TaxID=96344 RepID=UPI0014382B98|nr:hypothetical protein [Cupriavidus oxalaticus]
MVVGINIIGALMAIAQPNSAAGPLSLALRTRGALLADAFSKVVVAQFWIAAINTAFTAALLFVAFPIFDVNIPTPAGWSC